MTSPYGALVPAPEVPLPADAVTDLFNEGDGANAFMPADPADASSDPSYAPIPAHYMNPTYKPLNASGPSAAAGSAYGAYQPFNVPLPGKPGAAGGKGENPFNKIEVGKMGNVRDMRNLGSEYDAEARGKGGQVKYLDNTGRKKYEVTMGATILRTATGIALDSSTIFKHYFQKHAGADLGMATWGRHKKGSGLPFAILPEWSRGSLIWVCAPDKETDRPKLYSHVCKIGKFHHSSFNDGGGVIGAGEWIVETGKLKYISANSGHYRPDLQTFYHAVLHMSTAFNADTKVLMYDTLNDEWLHRPVKDFISAPSGNGRYKTHPDA